MKQVEILVTPEGDALRLDQYLVGKEGIETRGIAQRLIREGRVRVNGKVVKKSAHKISAGDLLVYDVVIPQPVRLEPLFVPLEILYEDAALIAVNKPPHMVVHPAAGHVSDTLVNALLAHTEKLASLGGPYRPGIVHRLDKGTSGVILVAKTNEAYLSLVQQFKERRVKKRYLALVYGHMPEEEGMIDHAIARNRHDRKKMAVVRVPVEGREAVTYWKVRGRFPGMSFLELSPQTGRTHQLRVHLASLGHPIVGDPVYGRRRFPTTGALAPLAKEVRRLGRQALHAWKVTFFHPETGKRVRLTAPCPEDLKMLYGKMERLFASEEDVCNS